MRRTIVAVMLAFAVFATVAPTPAHAGARDHEPATRSYVAYVIVERALLADVPNRNRGEYWQGSECFGDIEFQELSFRQRRRICYLAAMGIIGDTGRNDVYPTFEPRAHLRRDQGASVVWRLATFGEDAPPDHAATFIDVSRRSPHADAIRWGAFWGVIEGYDGEPATFRPAKPLSRLQARNLVDRAVAHWRSGAAR